MHDTLDNLQPKDRALHMWRTTTLSMLQIGDMCGLTKGSVAGLVARSGVKREVERVVLDPFDDNLRALAVIRAQNGEDLRYIAYDFNVTPQAIRSWMRARTTSPEKKEADKLATRIRRRDQLRKRRLVARAATPRATAKPNELPAPPPPPIPETRRYRVTLFGLRLGMCRDIQASNVVGGRYCAEPTKAGSSYCPAHHAIYYVPFAPRSRKAVNYTMRQPERS